MNTNISIKRIGAFTCQVKGAVKRHVWSCEEDLGAAIIRLGTSDNMRHYWYAILDDGTIFKSHLLNVVIKAVSKEIEARAF